MVRNLDVLRKYCEFSDQEAELLSSSASPIVLLRLRSGSGLPVKQLSPDAPELLGVMLPTSPLHVLLFSDGQKDYFDFLVMTSGNRSGEPICLDNSSALKKLGGCVDGFLLHNREILRICDDSVCRFHNDRFFMIRRARGYVPEKISLQKPVSAQVLAMGADLKNTLCFAFPDYVIMSQHVGDLNSLPAAELHEKLISSLPDFFNFSPAKIAVDLHPDFVSSTLGRKLAKERNLELVEVQHHHAHAAGVMAEYGLSEALAVILDGHGYGTDCNSWGAELLHVKMPGFRRLVSWQNIALIGGDKMALQPQRSAFSALSELGGEQFLSRFCKTLGISDQMADNFRRIKPQSSLTSSAGRYFDAAACIAGCAPEQITYEGQAAICLESLALKYLRSLKSPCKLEPYIMEWLKNKDDLLIFRMPLVLAQMWDDINDGKFRRAPLRFHITVAHVIREMARIGRLKTGLQSVVLSGGVFQNMLLVELSLPLLEADGFSVYLPVKTPCNDGGIAFGQAVVAGYENIIG
jgi:hydrogenase maturation protein HypF